MGHVSDAMVRDVVALAGDTSLDAASRLFALHQISGAPVIEEDGRPIGVVSHRDLIDPDRPRSGGAGRRFYYRIWNGDVRAIGLVTEGPHAEPGVALDVMSSPLVTIAHDATIEEAARLLLATGLHRLFVVEGGRLIGVLTALDCLRTLVGTVERPCAP